jgi:predicted anti-sigma-YlaC factor YlaD
MSWSRKRKETQHRAIEEQLSAYLDGELLPRERKAVEQHLADCPSCRWHLKTLRQTVQWTSELPTVRVPRTFTIPVPARPAPAVRRSRFVPVLQGATALVALLLFFVVAGDAVLTGFQPARVTRPEPQALAVQATNPAEQREGTVASAVVVETVVVEMEVESPMLPETAAAEAPPAEPSVAEESAGVLGKTPTETAKATADAEIAATMAPPGAGESLEDARKEELAVVEGAAPTASYAQPSLALEVPAPSPTATVSLTTAPTPEPAPTEAAMAASEYVEAEEALPIPSPEPLPEGRAGLRPAVMIGVRWTEYVLGVLFIVLVGATIGAMVWRRSRR